jgi:hypothetical protein
LKVKKRERIADFGDAAFLEVKERGSLITVPTTVFFGSKKREDAIFFGSKKREDR